LSGAAGWRVAVHGQKAYNGVALLSRHPIEDVTMGLPGDPADEQAELLAERVLAGEVPLRELLVDDLHDLAFVLERIGRRGRPLVGDLGDQLLGAEELEVGRQRLHPEHREEDEDDGAENENDSRAS